MTVASLSSVGSAAAPAAAVTSSGESCACPSSRQHCRTNSRAANGWKGGWVWVGKGRGGGVWGLGGGGPGRTVGGRASARTLHGPSARTKCACPAAPAVLSQAVGVTLHPALQAVAAAEEGQMGCTARECSGGRLTQVAPQVGGGEVGVRVGPARGGPLGKAQRAHQSLDGQHLQQVRAGGLGEQR